MPVTPREPTAPVSIEPTCGAAPISPCSCSTSGSSTHLSKPVMLALIHPGRSTIATLPPVVIAGPSPVTARTGPRRQAAACSRSSATTSPSGLREADLRAWPDPPDGGWRWLRSSRSRPPPPPLSGAYSTPTPYVAGRARGARRKPLISSLLLRPSAAAAAGQRGRELGESGFRLGAPPSLVGMALPMKANASSWPLAVHGDAGHCRPRASGSPSSRAPSRRAPFPGAPERAEEAAWTERAGEAGHRHPRDHRPQPRDPDLVVPQPDEGDERPRGDPLSIGDSPLPSYRCRPWTLSFAATAMHSPPAPAPANVPGSPVAIATCLC